MKNNMLYFILGILMGSIITYLICTIKSNSQLSYNANIETLRNDTNQRLIDYIDGRWISAIGDVVVNISLNTDLKDITVTSSKIEKTYKITNIEYVDGFFGYTKLIVCDVKCDKNNSHTLQINKIFGVDNTIVITYDHQMADCIEPKNFCSRAFKLVD
jgi:hypothetical protein